MNVGDKERKEHFNGLSLVENYEDSMLILTKILRSFLDIQDESSMDIIGKEIWKKETIWGLLVTINVVVKIVRLELGWKMAEE